LLYKYDLYLLSKAKQLPKTAFSYKKEYVPVACAVDLLAYSFIVLEIRWNMGSYEQKEQSDYSSPNTNKTTLVRLNY